MSIFSEHECRALDDFEFDCACTEMNNQEAYYEFQDEYDWYEEE